MDVILGKRFKKSSTGDFEKMVWFQKEVLMQRCFRSLVWMTLFHLAVTEGVIFLIKVFSWYPLTAIGDWYYFLFNFKALCYRLLMHVICFTFAISHVNLFEVKHCIYSSRCEIIRTWTSPLRLSTLVLFSVLGSLLTFCFYSLLSLYAVQSTRHFFLSQRFLSKSWQDLLFVGGHGFFTGLLFCFHYFTEEMNLLNFSLEEKSMFETFQRKSFESLRRSLGFVFNNLHRYCFLYITCDFFVYKWTIGDTSEIAFLSRLFNLINVDLFIATVTSSAFLCFTWDSCIVIFELFATQRYIFMIKALSKEESNRVLTNVMANSELTLSKSLAFLDLRWLAEFSPERREMFFAISHPGGHPHLWNALSDISTTILKEFIVNLQKISLLMQPSHSPPKISTTVLVQSNFSYLSIQCWQKFSNYVTEKPLWKYFNKEFPDVEALRLFTNCQAQIWLVEALGHFITTAYTQDVYGVVQTSLPNILQLLIDLKLCEEKLPIGVMSFKKYVRDSRFLRIGKLRRQQLNCAVDSTLRQIAKTFQNDIRRVFLPDNYKRHLEKYLEVKP